MEWSTVTFKFHFSIWIVKQVYLKFVLQISNVFLFLRSVFIHFVAVWMPFSWKYLIATLKSWHFFFQVSTFANQAYSASLEWRNLIWIELSWMSFNFMNGTFYITNNEMPTFFCLNTKQSMIDLCACFIVECFSCLAPFLLGLCPWKLVNHSKMHQNRCDN